MDKNNDIQRYKITIDELIPGDLLIIDPKNEIPADCIIIQGELTLDEGMLTGEVNYFKIF